MATTDFAGRYHGQRVWDGLAGTFRHAWQDFLRRREERRTLIAVSRLGPQAMRDIGLDPEQVYEVLGGGYDKLPVNRSVFPRGSHL